MKLNKTSKINKISDLFEENLNPDALCNKLPILLTKNYLTPNTHGHMLCMMEPAF